MNFVHNLNFVQMALCVCALLAAKPLMRKEQRRNGDESMKKKLLALLLGGATALSSLGAAVPMRAWAAEGGQTCDSTRKHFTSCTLTPGDGEITVQWECDIAQTEKGPAWNRNDITFWVYGEEIPDGETKTHMEVAGGESSDGGEFDWVTFGEADPPGPTGSCTVTGLANGTPYYVYADVAVNVDAQGQELSINVGGPEEIDHKYMYVGSCTPGDGALGNAGASAEDSGSTGETGEASEGAFLEEVQGRMEEALGAGILAVLQHFFNA